QRSVRRDESGRARQSRGQGRRGVYVLPSVITPSRHLPLLVTLTRWIDDDSSTVTSVESWAGWFRSARMNSFEPELQPASATPSGFTMLRYSRRLNTPLATGLAIVSMVITWKELRTEQLVRQIALQQRAESVAGVVQERAEPLLQRTSTQKLGELADDLAASERVVGVAIHDIDGKLLGISSPLGTRLGERPAVRAPCTSIDRGCGDFAMVDDEWTYVYTSPLHRNHTTAALATTFHDAGGLSTWS